MTRWKVVKHNFHQSLISIDQALYNIGGLVWSLLACVFRRMPEEITYADETLSSRCWRLERDCKVLWPRIIIDCLFFWESEHCFQSYLSEREGRQLPPELR